MKKGFVDHNTWAKSSSHKANAREWRLFMSPKVSNTLSNVAGCRSAIMEKEGKLQKDEFDKIFQEVEKLGTSQLTWKRRKEIEMQKMVALGAKPEKGQKMPISMGRNIKRKRERMEEQTLQNELASGLFTRKRAKKSLGKARSSDKGLQASEGVFKGGVLYVKPLSTKMEESTGPSNGRGKPSRNSKKSKRKGKRRKR